MARCLLTVALVATTALYAQQADVSGVVRDSSGAAVPRAAITLLQLQSGIRRHALSDDRGLYAIPAARPGNYRISVRKEGFQTSAHNGIVLASGEHARFDFTLIVGQVEESVNVNDRKPQQPPDDASTGTNVNRRMVENLPNNGRSLLPLIEAAPGVVIVPAGGGEVGQFSVNGQRSNANYMTVDGVSANFAVNDGLPGQAPSGSTPVLTALGSMQTVVSVEALDQVQIKTSTTPAEYGRLPGGQIAMTTRSGGNQFHGSVFEYFRNDKLDANDWFSNSVGLPRALLRSNDYGASFGGPLIKNKTFFFAAFEGLDLVQPYTVVDSVPSNPFRQQASPIVSDFLAAYPVPNGPISGDMAQLTAAVSRHSELNSSSLRLDHNFSDRAQFFLRGYSTPSSAQGSGASLFSEGQLNLDAHGVTAGLNVALSPRTLNDLRFGYATATARYGVVPAFQTAANGNLWTILPPVAPAGVTNYEVQVYGLEPVVATSGDRHTQSQWNAVDSLTLIRGKHEWKLGGDFRRITPSLSSQPYSLYASFDSLASLALGQISQLTVNHQDPLALEAKNLSLFAQDTWRVRSNLTLNLGLRWEWNPPMTGQNGDVLQPVLNIQNPQQAALSTGNTPLWSNRTGNFAPRAGIAWRPIEGRNLTIRAGAGVYYDLGYGVAMSSLASSAPYFTSNTIYGTSIYNPDPQLLLPNANPPYAQGFAYQPGFHLPMSVHWNAGVEQGLGRAAAISATYVSIGGSGLLRREWLSDPNPTFTGVDVTTNDGFSNYRALQVQLRSRMESSLQYLVSFNWARSID
ncbi:MAG TPA: TonB-dependent receptor, partial [Bryobacteraceae bacterium]